MVSDLENLAKNRVIWIITDQLIRAIGLISSNMLNFKLS